VKDYRPPDEDDKHADDLTKKIRAEGVAPRPLTPSEDSDDSILSFEDKGLLEYTSGSLLVAKSSVGGVQ